MQRFEDVGIATRLPADWTLERIGDVLVASPAPPADELIVFAYRTRGELSDSLATLLPLTELRFDADGHAARIAGEDRPVQRGYAQLDERAVEVRAGIIGDAAVGIVMPRDTAPTPEAEAVLAAIVLFEPKPPAPAPTPPAIEPPAWLEPGDSPPPEDSYPFDPGYEEDY